MINANPMLRLMAEKEINFELLSQLTGINLSSLYQMKDGLFITNGNLDTLCQVLNCQPCDLIEFSKTETKGHWEWIENQSNSEG